MSGTSEVLKLDKTLSLFYDKNKALSNPALSSYLEALKAEAAQRKTEPLCELPFHAFKQFDTTGNRISYENLYFHRRRCLGVFALMAWLYEDTAYLSLTEDYLWAVCNEFTWALPAHLNGDSLKENVNPLQLDLFATETAQTLAEILFLLKDNLNPAIFFRCKSEIERRIFSVFLSRPKPYWWETCHMNWAAVCAGSIGMAAIYLMQKEETERLSLLLSQLIPVTEYFLSGFENDGTCLEGLSYWTYGMSYFTAFADLLCHRSGGKLDLLAQDKVRAIAAFQGKCYFKGGHTVSFSDASAKDTFRIGITSYLSRYFHHEIPLPPAQSAAAFGTDPCARWCQMFRDFVWADETVLRPQAAPALSPENKTNTPASTVCVLPDAKWLIFEDETGCGGAIKGGHNDEPHNHNDVGSFFFLLRGSEVLTDLGAGEYTKDSFSDRRYTIFTNSSFSHSVPVINGKGQKNGREAAARDYDFFADGGSMDIAPAYEEASLKSLVRTLRFDSAARQLILSDSYCFTEPPISLEERFVTRQEPALGEGEVSLYSESGEVCRLSFDASLLAASVSTDIHYRHEDGAEELVYLLRLTLKNPETSPVLLFTIDWN